MIDTVDVLASVAQQAREQNEKIIEVTAAGGFGSGTGTGPARLLEHGSHTNGRPPLAGGGGGGGGGASSGRPAGRSSSALMA